MLGNSPNVSRRVNRKYERPVTVNTGRLSLGEVMTEFTPLIKTIINPAMGLGIGLDIDNQCVILVQVDPRDMEKAEMFIHARELEKTIAALQDALEVFGV
jgi:hypothetical protein